MEGGTAAATTNTGRGTVGDVSEGGVAEGTDGKGADGNVGDGAGGSFGEGDAATAIASTNPDRVEDGEEAMTRQGSIISNDVFYDEDETPGKEEEKEEGRSCYGKK